MEPQWTLSAGVTASSLSYASVSSTARRWIPGYARLDLAAAWRINDAMQVQLNINNALDKKYFHSAYPIYATWAPARAALLSLHITQ